MEAFADRAYTQEGKLVPRGIPGAVITEHREIIKRAEKMIKEGTVKTIDKKEIEIGNIHTLCVHGDTPGAVEIAERLRRELAKKGIKIKPMAEILK